MPEFINHYKVLEVPPSATQDEIRKSFLVFSKKYHPDLGNGTAERAAKFNAVTLSYGVLKNPEMRQKYDAEFRTRLSSQICARCEGKGQEDVQKGFGNITKRLCKVCTGTGLNK